MELADAVVEYVESVFQSRNKAQPATVVAFDKQAGTVDIRLSITTDNRGSAVTLYGVPVCYPAGGQFRVTFPIDTGSQGIALFSDVSLDEWKQTRKPVKTDDNRSDALSDCLFVPSIDQHTNIGDTVTIQRGSGSLGDDNGVVRKKDLQALVNDVNIAFQLLDAKLFANNGNMTFVWAKDPQSVSKAKSSKDVRVS